MAKFIDLTGERFGRLAVIERDSGRKGVYWICKCECGRIKSVKSDSLRNGLSKSCGCLQSELRTNNLIEHKYGKLTVIERVSKEAIPQAEHHAYWRCQCDCGNHCIVRGSELKRGTVQSCGCLRKEVSTKHGMRHTKAYTEWVNVKQRCYNSKNSSYKDYGERGITMCEAWRNDFKKFYDDVSNYLTLAKRDIHSTE